jgi:hypothetical protein
VQTLKRPSLKEERKAQIALLTACCNEKKKKKKKRRNV